jgi:hypothetical protein
VLQHKRSLGVNYIPADIGGLWYQIKDVALNFMELITGVQRVRISN